jgi:hypothetical protein
LVQILLVDLEFEEGSVDLVDDDDRLDSFTEGLAEDGFGLDADAFDTVDDDEGSVRDSESGSDLGRKIDVAGRINKIDQEPASQKGRFWDANVLGRGFLLGSLGLLSNVFDIFLAQLGVEGDGGGLDGDATVLLVLTRVRKPLLTGLCRRYNPCL